MIPSLVPELGKLAAKVTSPPVSISRKDSLFTLSTTVTLTSILSRSPAGVTRLPKSYGEQVQRAGQGRGSHYCILEILNPRLRREIPNSKQQIPNSGYQTPNNDK